MYVKIFKTAIIVFFRWRQNVFNVTLTDNFQYQCLFLRMQVTNWPNNFVDQGQFSDTDFSRDTHQKENVQFANNVISHTYIYSLQFSDDVIIRC